MAGFIQLFAFLHYLGAVWMMFIEELLCLRLGGGGGGVGRGGGGEGGGGGSRSEWWGNDCCIRY